MKIEVQKWAFAFVKEGVKACHYALWHLCTVKTVISQIYSNWPGKKVPQSARLSEGRGVRSLFGQCPNRPSVFFSGASLSAPNHPGKGSDLPNQANAPLNMDNSSQNKCPKPFGQGSRPPPLFGQCPNRPCVFLSGASRNGQGGPFSGRQK